MQRVARMSQRGVAPKARLRWRHAGVSPDIAARRAPPQAQRNGMARRSSGLLAAAARGASETLAGRDEETAPSRTKKLSEERA